MLTHFVDDIIVFAPFVLPQNNWSFDSGNTKGVMPAHVPQTFASRWGAYRDRREWLREIKSTSMNKQTTAQLQKCAIHHREESVMKFFVSSLTLLLTLAGSTNAQSSVSLGDQITATKALRSVFAINESTAVAVGDSGTIMKTSDGGEVWQTRTSGTIFRLSSVYFVNNLLGWSVGSGGTLLHTTDGGENWSAQPSGGTYTLASTYFRDSLNGWAVGVGRILHTTNGGNTWNSQAYGGQMTGIQFPHSSNGWVSEYFGHAYRSTDDGATWSTAGPSATYFGSVSFSGPRDGWLGAFLGQIFHSSDSGVTWAIQALPTGKAFSSIYAVDSLSVWAVGGDRTIIHSTDEGSNWTIQRTQVGGYLYSVHFTNSQVGWAVGDSLQILHTTDGGSSWERQRKDLGIASILSPSGYLPTGSIVVPAALIRNFGGQPASGLVKMTIDESYSDTMSISLLPDSTRVLSFSPWQSYQKGPHMARCEVFLQGDRDTTNNVLSSSFMISFDNDLGIVSILSPMEYIPRDTVIVPSVVIRNFGSQSASAIVKMNIDGVYSDSIHVSLLPDSSNTVEFSNWSATKLGSHRVHFEVNFTEDQDLGNNVKENGFFIYSLAGDPHLVVFPATVGNNGVVTVTITGIKFQTGTRVILARPDYPDYIVDSTWTIHVDSTKLRVMIDFQDQPLGRWNVLVVNPDSSCFLTPLKNGLLIEKATSSLWTHIYGMDWFGIIGHDYTVSYGNSGNMDAIEALLLIRGIPREINITKHFTFDLPPSLDSTIWRAVPEIIETDHEKILAIVIPILHAGASGSISFRLNLPREYLQMWDPGVMPLPIAPFDLTSGIASMRTHLYRSQTMGRMITNDLYDPSTECGQLRLQGILNLIQLLPGADCVNAFMNTLLMFARTTPKTVNYTTYLFSQLKDYAFCAGQLLAYEVTLPYKVFSFLTDEYSLQNDMDENNCTPEQRERKRQEVWFSLDPNSKSGLVGYDTTSHFVPNSQPFSYTIHFENLPTATAAAETVVVSDTLDRNFEWNTLQLSEVSHPSLLSVNLDSVARSITWSFNGINLPPNVTPPQGEGWIEFNVSPKNGLASGTQVKNSASIVFDYNLPITTNTYLNTIDKDKPSSHVLTLPDTTTAGEFAVHWTGEDDSSGSGINTYDVFVRYDTGSYKTWLVGVTDTMAVFVGDNERVHSFYSIATDNVGNREDSPSIADAVTWVSGISPPLCISPKNRAAMMERFPQLQWSHTAGKSGQYTLQYSTDSLFVNDLHFIDNLADTSYTLTDSLTDGSYFWRVGAINRFGTHSGYRSPSRFVVDNVPPQVPVLLSLRDESGTNDTTPTFKWSASAGDRGRYYFECATDSSFDTLKAASSTSDTMYTVPEYWALNNNALLYWHVRAVDKAGNSSTFQACAFRFAVDTSLTGIVPRHVLPEAFALYQNYPNPFNPITKVVYQLPIRSKVRLRVYNVLGQLVTTLADEFQDPGYKVKEWNAADYASGVYFYCLEATSANNGSMSFTQVKKMLLIK